MSRGGLCFFEYISHNKTDRNKTKSKQEFKFKITFVHTYKYTTNSQYLLYVLLLLLLYLIFAMLTPCPNTIRFYTILLSIKMHTRTRCWVTTSFHKRLVKCVATGRKNSSRKKSEHINKNELFILWNKKIKILEQ